MAKKLKNEEAIPPIALYNILVSEKKSEIESLLAMLPESNLKSTAELLALSDDHVTTLLAFGTLLPEYSNGASIQWGESLGFASYYRGKDLFLAQQQAVLLLSTVVGCGYHYVTALNFQSKFAETLQFIEREQGFWISYAEWPERLKGDRKAFEDNLKSILIAKVSALFSLGKIEEAQRLAVDPSLEGNWAADVELRRLRALIEGILISPEEMNSEEERAARLQKTDKESKDAMLEALKGMIDSQGRIPDIIDKLSSSPSLDPNTREGFDALEHLLEKGETFLQKGSNEINEISVRQIIRKSAGIFVDNQPKEPEILTALEKLKEGLKSAQQLNNSTLINDALYGMYLCYSRLGKSSEAADQLILLRKNLEHLRKGIAEPLKRGGVFQTYKYLFLSSVEHLYKANRFNDMLDAIEGAKGRTIVDILEKESNQDTQEFAVWDIHKKLEPLIDEEKFHYVSYHVDTDCTYVVLVTIENRIYAYKLDLSKESISRFVKNNLNNPLAWFQQRKIKIVRELEPLVSWMQPLIDEGVLEEGDHICYSSDDLLYLFPISYLNVKGKRLIDWFSLSRIHNAGHLIHLLNKPPGKPDTAISIAINSTGEADRAPFSEIPNLLLKYFPKNTTVSDEQADIETIMEKCNGKELIQFTTHGVYTRNQNPFKESGILVADHEELPTVFLLDELHQYSHDGEHLLSPSRLLGGAYKDRRFDSAHISLQACVTGYSLEGIAGDAIGLEWAFLQKGAVSLMSTFWNVDINVSNTFMTLFYDQWLARGQSKASACQHAMLAIRDKAFFPDAPEEFGWAAFELIGDWR